jgi:hypothetical protein
MCLKSNIQTAVEWYRDTQLNYCSYHYWLVRGRNAGGVIFSLDVYVESSKTHAFATSLPSAEEMARMGGDSGRPANDS